MACAGKYGAGGLRGRAVNRPSMRKKASSVLYGLSGLQFEDPDPHFDHTVYRSIKDPIIREKVHLIRYRTSPRRPTFMRWACLAHTKTLNRFRDLDDQVAQRLRIR
jgi:hypothetical protein